jgi:hypothetical protein
MMATPVVIPSTDEKHSKARISEPENESLNSGEAEKLDPDYGSYKDHIFANEEVANHWRGVCEKAKYEGRHRFDPSFTWSAEEEKRVRRKVRYPVLTFFCRLENVSPNKLLLDRFPDYYLGIGDVHGVGSEPQEHQQM